MVSLPAAAFGHSSCASPTDGYAGGSAGSTRVGSTLGSTHGSAGFTGFGTILGAPTFPGGPSEQKRRRPTAVEFLVKDRFMDFEKLARQMNSLPAMGSTAPATTPQAAEKKSQEKGFMREFFEIVNEIQGVLNAGKRNVKEMGEVLEDSLMATTQDRQKETSDRLGKLVEDTNKQVSVAKSALEVLKHRSDAEEAKKPGSAEGKIRQNMQVALAKKHQQLLIDFQKAQMDYKKALEKRQFKEMEILMPEATEQERANMIAAGETTQLAVAKKMAGAHALLLDEVRHIREKHQDILRLEQSIGELAQMFQEMAVLVESQGEMLDAIELNVNQTKGVTAKAEVQLIKTRKEQHKYSKWMCCLSILLLIVVIVVIGPVLLSNGG
mmetsp:Transcript_25225/g.53611  ORF Transcript_25225/g.53611 Transcript_25225/m.53611 type:complete len:381 (-) Transcript_25225:244-1386(-)